MTWDTKKEFKSAFIGFIGFIIVITLIIKFKLNTVLIILLLSAYTGIKQIIMKNYDLKKYFKAILYIIIIVPLVSYIIRTFGVTGFFISIIFLVSATLYSRRKKYFEAKNHIESLIWGKPLMEFKKNGEKPPKIKFKL